MAPKKAIQNDAAKYVKLDPREHVLARPAMYIGSTQKQSAPAWMYDVVAKKMVKGSLDIVPALYKIVDEIFVNAVDHSVRLRMIAEQDSAAKINHVKKIQVNLNQEQGIIEVTNDGDGIEVAIHEEYKVYIPELIFGNMLTSSNYDDTEERIIGGQNGIGAKACNIFSESFTVETVDKKRKLKYTQTFTHNMSEKTKPAIEKCTIAPYTTIRFKPDYAKFGCDGLSEDMYKLMYKRALDICALTDSKVKVTVNGEDMDVKNFETYADLYLGSKSEHKRVYERVNDRWEVILTTNDTGEFEHVSFVNGIWTLRGGKHVDHVADQVVKRVLEYMAKKKKDLQLKPKQIKDQLMIFVKATISNPTFDNQSKETLTTPVSQFGSKCDISLETVSKLMTAELLDKLVSMNDHETGKQLKKTDGKKKNKLIGIAKLDDANWAGTAKSNQCTLILCEGDSAKSMAISGLSVVGRDKYGVFSLRGKLLNVRDAAEKRIAENAEITAIKQILGLEARKTYKDVNELRYGRIMIMTDADEDGHHIKGLIFNLIYSLWPSLITQPNFMMAMLTPIVKARKGAQTLAFYNLTDYKKWLMETNGGQGWTVKYYKGLGTSNAQEAKEYFKQLKTLEYTWAEETSGESLDLAFNKKRADDRKTWISQHTPQSTMDYNQTHVTFNEYVDKELRQFSVYNLERSIPSMVDGLKRSTRKILYCSFKRNLVKEIRVAQLAGYVSEHGAYHHGEASLQEAIINMAQDFVGANNVNLLKPNGQFGCRLEGGKDSASPRYIHTELNNIVFNIFSKLDNDILEYLEDDGDPIEPQYYIPVLPMALVNGTSGIGTGFSTSIPAYNPKQIVEILRQLIHERDEGRDEQVLDIEELTPWYQGFRGSIYKDGHTFVSRGVFKKVGENKVEILELPIGTWTTDYKEFLESILSGDQKILKDYESHYTEKDVRFVLHFYPGALEQFLVMDKNGVTRFDNEFKMVSSKGLSVSNMHLFDATGCIHLYSSVAEVIKSYFLVRWDAYIKRKEFMVNKWEQELVYLKAKVRFIQEVIKREIVVFDKPKKAIEDMLREREYPTSLREQDGAFDYLIKMPIYTLTQERKEALINDMETKQAQVDKLKATSIADLWREDLDAFELEYDALVKARGGVPKPLSTYVPQGSAAIVPTTTKLVSPKLLSGAKKTTSAKKTTAKRTTAKATTTGGKKTCAKKTAVVKEASSSSEDDVGLSDLDSD
jgi:DNA topoisomerase-2